MPTPSLSKTRTGGSPAAINKPDTSERTSRAKPGGVPRSAPKPGDRASDVAAGPEQGRRRARGESAPTARADKGQARIGTQEQPARRARAATRPEPGRSGRGGQARAIPAVGATPPTPTAPAAANSGAIAMPARQVAVPDPTPTPTAGPDLAKLADKINASHHRGLESFLKHARRTGQLLIRAKERVGHGRFGAWIEANCCFSPESARGYMRVAEDWEALTELVASKRQPVTDLTLKGALRLLARPRPEALPAPVTSRPAKADTSGPTSSQCRTTADADPPVGRRRGRSSTPVGRDDGVCDPAPRPLPVDADPNVRPAASKSRGVTDSRDRTPEARDGAGGAEALAPLSTTDPEDRLGDTAWLATLPVRSRLADPAAFDVDALLWRRLRPGVGHLLGLYRPTAEDVAKAGVLSWVRRRYAYRIALLTGVTHPRDWRVCGKCRGKGVSAVMKTMSCTECNRSGFEIGHEGDRPADDAGATSDG
jgi:hypothetical protein